MQRSAQAGAGLRAGRRAAAAAARVRRLVCPHRRQQVITLPVCFASRSLPVLLAFSCSSPTSHLFLFRASPGRQAPRTDPVRDRLSLMSGDATPGVASVQLGLRPNEVLLSFPRRAPLTPGEVKDSGAPPAHSQGRSRGLESPLPVPTSPGRFGLQRALLLDLAVSCVPRRWTSSSPGYRIREHALVVTFAPSFGRLERAQTQECKLGSVSLPRPPSSPETPLRPPPAAWSRCQKFSLESLGTLLIRPGARGSSGT